MSGSSSWAALRRSLSPAYPTTNAVRNDNSLVHLKAWPKFSRTFDPLMPVPPITTIFMTTPPHDGFETTATPKPLTTGSLFIDSPGWSSPTLRLLAGCCARCEPPGHRRPRHELASPHIGP